MIDRTELPNGWVIEEKITCSNPVPWELKAGDVVLAYGYEFDTFVDSEVFPEGAEEFGARGRLHIIADDPEAAEVIREVLRDELARREQARAKRDAEFEAGVRKRERLRAKRANEAALAT